MLNDLYNLELLFQDAWLKLRRIGTVHELGAPDEPTEMFCAYRIKDCILDKLVWRLTWCILTFRNLQFSLVCVPGCFCQFVLSSQLSTHLTDARKLLRLTDYWYIHILLHKYACKMQFFYPLLFSVIVTPDHGVAFVFKFFTRFWMTGLHPYNGSTTAMVYAIETSQPSADIGWVMTDCPDHPKLCSSQ